MPRRVMRGTVVGDKADKTVVVRVDRRVMHPLYKKVVRRSKRYTAHDDANTHRVGDIVQIRECAPISKRKRWIVLGDAGAEQG